jgi:small subunit ribosomal protein S7
MMKMKEEELYKKFIGLLIKKGQKERAIKVFNNVLRLLYEEYKILGILVIKEVVEKLKPKIAIRVKHAAGVTHRLPVIIKEEKEYGMAIKWIIKSMSDNMERGMVDKLYKEIVNLKEGIGVALKRKEELYKIAVTNRPFMRLLKRRRKSKFQIRMPKIRNFKLKARKLKLQKVRETKLKIEKLKKNKQQVKR